METATQFCWQGYLLGHDAGFALKLQTPTLPVIERFEAQIETAEASGSCGENVFLLRREFTSCDASEQTQVGRVLKREHVASVADALRAGPIVGHISHIGTYQRILQRLFLAPAVLGTGMVEKSDEGIVRGLLHAQP